MSAALSGIDPLGRQVRFSVRAGCRPHSTSGASSTALAVRPSRRGVLVSRRGSIAPQACSGPLNLPRCYTMPREGHARLVLRSRARPALPSIGSRVIGTSDARRLHMDWRTQERVENLQGRLRAVAERVDQLRGDVTRLAADLRSRLQAFVLQRQRVRDESQRDNQPHIHQQTARSRSAPGQSRHCEASGCTNPRGAFTSERHDRIYEFCSEACRAAFERPAA